MLDFSHKTILISRTDSIGDVCLTLPLCGYLKQRFAGIRIVFLGNTYTAPVLACCPDIDLVLSWKELSQLPENEQLSQLKALGLFAAIHVFPQKEVARLVKKCGVPNRIGTSHRLFHWLTCSHRVDFTRKNAEEHESQLNFHLLKPTGLTKLPTIDEVQAYVHFAAKEPLPEWLAETLHTHQPKVILHPKSQGSAVEWGVNRFAELGLALVNAGFAVYYTGTEKEAESFRHLIPPGCVDTTGKLSLSELITLIHHTDALVAASTGPLHLAGLLEKRAVGLFAPRRPIHPGRWRPLGVRSTTLVFDENCAVCAAGKPCKCIEQIRVQRVIEALQPDPHRHS
jgi:heptosyltransferase III